MAKVTNTHERVYGFGAQYAVGQEGENFIDEFLLNVYGNAEALAVAPLPFQLMGIDRLLLAKDGQRLTLEYKTDTKTVKTGNVFVETKVDAHDGWAKSSMADVLVYYPVDGDQLLWVDMQRVKQTDWSAWPQSEVPNENYVATGHLVPLPEFKKATEALEIFHNQGK